MADIQKKVFKPFLVLFKLFECSCVRSHFGIPYDYRNGIGGIFNVSYSVDNAKKMKHGSLQKSESWPKYEKSRF
jgi:hypothetical protein